MEALPQFLECAINQILYARGVYPQDTFQSVNFNGVALHITMSEELGQYIRDAINSLSEFPSEPHHLVLSLLDANNQHLDAYCFSFHPNSHTYLFDDKNSSLKSCFAQLGLLGLFDAFCSRGKFFQTSCCW
ncbi:hypothetical protein GEMRC1_003025 [Eukaryota sp. GEM-RC1]